MRVLLQDSRFKEVRADLCVFGMTAVDPKGEAAAANELTKFLSGASRTSLGAGPVGITN